MRVTNFDGTTSNWRMRQPDHRHIARGLRAHVDLALLVCDPTSTIPPPESRLFSRTRLTLPPNARQSSIYCLPLQILEERVDVPRRCGTDIHVVGVFIHVEHQYR